jgi:hypothetical protein
MLPGRPKPAASVLRHLSRWRRSAVHRIGRRAAAIRRFSGDGVATTGRTPSNATSWAFAVVRRGFLNSYRATKGLVAGVRVVEINFADLRNMQQ